MATRTPTLIALLLLSACGAGNGGKDKPGSNDDTSVDTDTTTDPDKTNPIQVTGQVGSLVVATTARGVTVQSNYRISAMFADDLQGILTPNWCITGGACITELPAPGDDNTFSRGLFQADASNYGWVGNELFVGSIKVPFLNDTVRDLAYYDKLQPQNLDGDAVTLRLGGEWGDFEVEDFAVPAQLVLSSPDPLLTLGLQGTVPFRWTPPAEGNVYLRLEGGGLDRVYHLENTGEFDLDVNTLGYFDPLDVTVYFGMWIENEYDVNGNTLTTYGIWEQPYAGTDCTDYPNANFVGPVWVPAAPQIDPAYVVVGFESVLDGGVRDFLIDADGDAVSESHSALMWFEFFGADPVDPLLVGDYLCRVEYDASDTSQKFYVSGSGAIFEGHDVDLGDGSSDCDELDIAVWNTTDIRDVLESPMYDWGFGVGEKSDIVAPLEAFYAADWPTWEPLIAGGYISGNGVNAYEVNQVLTVGMSQCATVDPTLTAINAPLAAPLPAAFYSGTPVFAFAFAPPP